MSNERVFNFSAGPAALPLPVLQQVQEELLNYKGSGMSVMEMSHRSPEFTEIIENAEAKLRAILGISDDYAVLFLQGGASLQFSMVPMNLKQSERSVELIHTGSWTKKALTEHKKLTSVQVAATTEEDNFLRLPKPNEITLSGNASYVYMCSNNTIFGTQFKQFPDTHDVPLVADMSSDILSRTLNVDKFGVIFAGAQKNLGPAGVTVVIIRKDLAERVPDELPTYLQYRTHIKGKSLFNTPPTFAIYILGLVLEWVENQGGLTNLQKINQDKADLLYEAIEKSSLFNAPVPVEDRSTMNVVFRANVDDENLQKEFLSEASKHKLTNLKGHRSVGGFRASIYNAQTKEGVQTLVDFLKEFEKKKG